MQECKKKVGNYIINMSVIIGNGTYGRVCKALNMETNETCVCKIIQRRKDDISEQIENEAKLLQSAKGQYVVKLLYCGYSASNVYMVMEECNQGDLARYLKNNQGKLTEADILSIFRKIVIGYKESLYENKIIHRDLKLSNILINDGIPKICDFGNSIFMNSSQYLSESQVGKHLFACFHYIYHLLIGSPVFKPPQTSLREYQKNGGFKYSYKYDIFSLGILLYYSFYDFAPTNPQNEPQIAQFFENLEQYGTKQVVDFPPCFKISENTKEAIWSMLEYEEANRIDIESLMKHPMFDILEFKVKSRMIDESDISFSFNASSLLDYSGDNLVISRLMSNDKQQALNQQVDKYYLFLKNSSSLHMIIYSNLYHQTYLFLTKIGMQQYYFDLLLICLAKMQNLLLSNCYKLMTKKTKVEGIPFNETYFSSNLYYETFELISKSKKQSKKNMEYIWSLIEVRISREATKNTSNEFKIVKDYISQILTNKVITIKQILAIYRDAICSQLIPQVKNILENAPEGQQEDAEFIQVIYALLFVLTDNMKVKNYMNFNFQQFYFNLNSGIENNKKCIKEIIQNLML